jgi:putative phosphoribosyl transferase
MTFASRTDAGRRLGQFLAGKGVPADLVLGLPRGGVVVAAEVARILGLALDVLVVRKIGHPWHREFAVGAMAEAGVVVLDEKSIHASALPQASLDEVIAEEAARLREYQAKFLRAAPLPREGKTVILVDDGLATGATTEAAVLAAKQQQARRVIVAAPVASVDAMHRLTRVGAEVIALWVDPAFDAVGRYYDEFAQTTDEEVLALLRAGESTPRPPHA